MYQLAKILGLVRSFIIGLVLVAGVWFYIAVANSGHFGWGFQFIEDALFYLVLVVIALIADTVIVGIRIGLAVRRKAEKSFVQVLVGYLIAAWLLTIWFFLVLTH